MELRLNSVDDLKSLWLTRMMRAVGNPNLHDWEEIHSVHYEALIMGIEQSFNIKAYYSPWGCLLVCRIDLISGRDSAFVLKALGSDPDHAPNTVRPATDRSEAYKFSDSMCKRLGGTVLDMITKFNAENKRDEGV